MRYRLRARTSTPRRFTFTSTRCVRPSRSAGATSTPRRYEPDSSVTTRSKYWSSVPMPTISVPPVTDVAFSMPVALEQVVLERRSATACS